MTTVVASAIAATVLSADSARLAVFEGAAQRRLSGQHVARLDTEPNLDDIEDAMEKRERLRKKTRLPVRYGAHRPVTMGLITNVSARGVYVSTNAVLPLGAAVNLEVHLPSGEHLLLHGVVMRARRVASALATITTGGMGVRLEDPPPNWRTSLLLPDEP